MASTTTKVRTDADVETSRAKYVARYADGITVADLERTTKRDEYDEIGWPVSGDVIGVCYGQLG